MTPTQEAAMRQALEALEEINELSIGENAICLPAEIDDAMDALRAALAEPVQEPVAWRWGYRSVTTGEMDWRGYVEIAADPNLRSPAIVMEPLYTCTPPQAEPEGDALTAAYMLGRHDGKRKPLSDLAISEIYLEWDKTPGVSMADFARAVERAHGIGAQP